MQRREFLVGAMGLSLAAGLPPFAGWGAALAAGADPALWFPAFAGWASRTVGGKGGQIVKVTSLDSEGPGTFREAIQTKGPRIIVFEVGGVIDLDRKTIKIEEPFVTIAGQTAPSPGITFIKGGFDIATHEVIIQHIRIRPGEAGQAKYSGWNEDAISAVSAYNVVVDHCSCTWASDENLSASGPRFTGSTPDEWRAGTSHTLTYSNNIIAESLADSTHDKFEHSKGSLIHDNITELLIVGNLYAHNYERNALFKGGVHAVMANNLIYNPGPRAVHYNLQGNEWGANVFEVGKIVAVNNALRAGPSTPDPIAFFMLGGDGDVEYHGAGNVAVDRIGRDLPMLGRYTTGPAKIIEVAQPPVWPEGLQPMEAVHVERSVLMNAGARPWDRDYNDVRVLADTAEGRGKIIDSEQELHGYPEWEPTQRPFDPSKWEADTMRPLDPAVLDSGAKAKGT